MINNYHHFGHYLYEKRLITFANMVNARTLQRKNNSRIGETAKQRGWLTTQDLEEILGIQEKTFDKFGDIALERGYLSKAQLEELREGEEEEYQLFGEALVKLEIMTEEDLMKYLKEFNKYKLENQLSQTGQEQ